MRAGRLAACLLASGLLAGCVTPAVRAPLPPAEQAAAEARQDTREALLAQQPRWDLQGRIALSNGRQGGSGRLEWQQDGPNYTVALSAPVTRQSWRIVGDAAAVRLEGLEGGTRVGDDPAQLLREATGWDIPVTALADWVRGGRATAGGPAQLRFDADGRLAELEQAGWTIAYEDWRAQPALGLELPGRLTASRDQARVRLVVDQWDAVPAAP